MVRVVIRNIRERQWRLFRFELIALLVFAILTVIGSAFLLALCFEQDYCLDRLIQWGEKPWYSVPFF